MLFAQGCIVLEDRSVVNKGGHLLMRAIGGGAIGGWGGAVRSRGGAVGGRGGLGMVDRLGLGMMVHTGLWLVHVMRGQGGSGHMVSRGVMDWGVM